MRQPYPLLRAARWTFLVLAYLFAAVHLVANGLVPLIAGGAPLEEAGIEIPARVAALIVIVIGAPVLFLAFYVPSGLIAAVLEVRDKIAGGSCEASGKSG